MIAVVFKGARHKVSPKYCGGVLNPNARCYVYRTEGNTNPMPRIKMMRDTIVQRNAQNVRPA